MNDRVGIALRAPPTLRSIGSAMEFGVQFFPSVGPARKGPAQYWGEALALTALADQLGYAHVRTVEHYFHSYGGYSPDPLIFLAAAAARTRKIRLITGAVLPVFNNPLKLAGQIGMVDAISQGRLEVGFARAFLPHEFGRFGISMDESRARFDEGLEQIRQLLTEENVTCRGRFHSFANVTSQPRPTQTPRPPFWIAALSTKDSFENAGRLATEHHCTFMKFIGDAFLATFDKADQVLPFASAVQAVTESDPNIRDYHIGLRFSLHFGDVLCIETSYGKDILGEDINIAARLNDLAAPGQMVISQAALQRLSDNQKTLVGPSETARIRKAGDIQIHRFPLTAP